MLPEVGDLRLQVLLFDCNVRDIDNLDRLEGLLRQQIFVLALLHLESRNLRQLLLDEVFSDFDAAAHVFE